MKLRTKKIIAREFLLFLGSLALAGLIGLGLLGHRKIIRYKMDSIGNSEKYVRLEEEIGDLKKVKVKKRMNCSKLKIKIMIVRNPT